MFIEGKAVLFALSFKDPKLISSAIRDIHWDSTDIGTLVRQNTFNSSINGQLELKWRFVNALRTLRAHKRGAQVATEQTVMLPKEVLECDRFYWRRGLAPRKDHRAIGEGLRSAAICTHFLKTSKAFKTFSYCRLPLTMPSQEISFGVFACLRKPVDRYPTSNLRFFGCQ